MEMLVNGMKASVDKASVDAAKARSIADGASSQGGVVAKGLEALAKRVNKLEDKVFK